MGAEPQISSTGPSGGTTSAAPRSGRARIVAMVAALAALILLLRYLNVLSYVASSKDWIAAQGAFGAVVYTTVYIAATVLALPAFVLTLVAGGVYGLWKGFLLVSFASTMGATGAFLIARYIARDWIAQRISASPKFRALDEGVAREGWKLVVLTRLSPMFPFNLQNYGYGLTKIPLWHYVLTSWIGMMPGTLTYVYLGYATGGIVASGGKNTTNAYQWLLIAVGLIATIAVTFVATRIAQRALARVAPAGAAPSA